MSVPVEKMSVPNVVVPVEKTCSKCNETKVANKFPKDRNVCKDCGNAIGKEKRRIVREETLKNTVVVVITEKCCTKCNETKPVDKFVKSENLCKECNNKARKEKYKNDEAYKTKLIESTRKHYKTKMEKTKNEPPVITNKQCNVCNVVQPSTNFRIDRLKCIDCERNHGKEYRRNEIGQQKSKQWLENNSERMTELQAKWFQNNKQHVNEKLNIRRNNDPIYKFIIVNRSRLHVILKSSKSLHTMEYLDCNGVEFYEWISTHFNETINFENHGTVWHIDHVIPISTFNFQKDNVTEIAKIAFNWRNTMPLLKEHNLSKNNKIDREQIQQHWTHLIEYHEKHHKEIPHEFIDLFAKHLVDGKSLKV